MTDNDIKKALECCGFDEDMCLDCPAQCDCEKDTEAMIDKAKAILDLINRQKAEIEELTIELLAMRGAANSYKAEVKRLMPFGCQVEVSKKIEQEIKSEAIKEFADRLKEKLKDVPRYDVEDKAYYAIGTYGEFIDNLVKEMVGE